MPKNKPQKNIPKGWQETKLADIGIFSKGLGITKEQLSITGHNAVRYGELYTKFNFKIENIYSHIPTAIIPLTIKIKYGDILFAGSGETIDEIGKSASYLLHEDCYAGGDLIIFSPKKANSLFLSYFLNVGNGRKKLRELGQGQSIVHIYKRDVEKIKVDLPPLPEQNRIVGVLGVWDEYLGKLARKIEIKKKIKKGLMQTLLSGRVRLKGLSGDWDEVKLGDVCKMRSGGTPITTISDYYNGDIPWVSITDMTKNGKYIFKTERNLTQLGLENSSAVVYPVGTILYAMYASIGECSIAGSELSSSQAILGIQTGAKLNNLFLYYYLSSLKDKIKLMGQQGTQSNLNMGIVKKFVLKLPSIKAQESIVKILTIADREIEVLEKKKNIIEAQKKYLLNNLITGKIRVPV